jgi:hypothetical protein
VLARRYGVYAIRRADRFSYASKAAPASTVSFSNPLAATGVRGEKGGRSGPPFAAGGLGGLPRLRRPLWRLEVGKTVDLRSAW